MFVNIKTDNQVIYIYEYFDILNVINNWKLPEKAITVYTFLCPYFHNIKQIESFVCFCFLFDIARFFAGKFWNILAVLVKSARFSVFVFHRLFFVVVSLSLSFDCTQKAMIVFGLKMCSKQMFPVPWSLLLLAKD